MSEADALLRHHWSAYFAGARALSRSTTAVCEIARRCRLRGRSLDRLEARLSVLAQAVAGLHAAAAAETERLAAGTTEEGRRQLQLWATSEGEQVAAALTAAERKWRKIKLRS